NWNRSIYSDLHKKVINIESIISYGNLQLLSDLEKYIGFQCFENIIGISYIPYVYEEYRYDCSYYFYIAALQGNLDNMKWLKRNGYPCNTWTFKAATINGNLDNIKWLKENGCDVIEYQSSLVESDDDYFPSSDDEFSFWK
ncbi:hypothetical protein LCGC14_1072230, partial [marine sediment metagenome]